MAERNPISEDAQIVHDQRRQILRSGDKENGLFGMTYIPPEEVTRDPQGVEEKRWRIRTNPARYLGGHYWRNRRWLTLIFVNLFFVLSYRLDIQLLEGSLSASRLFGFHLADPYAAFQVWLAFGHVIFNLVIGVCTLIMLYLVVGGRAFCSWVCPYHLVSELAEKIHLRLREKKWVKDHPFQPSLRYFFWLSFLALSLVTGYTLFESISPVGILSRALIYGLDGALLWVLLLLGIEIFYSRRGWCRYVCPVGLTYRLVGALSLTKVRYDMSNCLHDGACRQVCLVPHVLEFTKQGKATTVRDNYVSGDCTNCGMCVDICPTHSLKFEVRFLNKLL